MSHYEFAVKVLRLPHILWSPHPSVPWCRLLSIVCYFFAGFPSFPPQSNPWCCSHPRLFTILTHHVSSCMVPGLSDTVHRYSKPSLKSRNCSTVLLQYYLQTRNFSPAKQNALFCSACHCFCSSEPFCCASHNTRFVSHNKAQPCKTSSGLTVVKRKSTHPHPLQQVRLPSQRTQHPGTHFPASMHEE